jgi:hypothetical protein
MEVKGFCTITIFYSFQLEFYVLNRAETSFAAMQEIVCQTLAKGEGMWKIPHVKERNTQN